ncbi:hypothetical protein [Paludifilum halophilum]|uniref:Uncharacterized protein n=1 Tax=Paludifilum halophilum TaxID=1642702 RepID=A0A235B6W9_9BACL|nr:hypothetical protein [Paludifilum halophilum]OYD08053.1 hypothetical protein CHM34_08035 [Paludifilum halophilum]
MKRLMLMLSGGAETSIVFIRWNLSCLSVSCILEMDFAKNGLIVSDHHLYLSSITGERPFCMDEGDTRGESIV